MPNADGSERGCLPRPNGRKRPAASMPDDTLGAIAGTLRQRIPQPWKTAAPCPSGHSLKRPVHTV